MIKSDGIMESQFSKFNSKRLYMGHFRHLSYSGRSFPAHSKDRDLSSIPMTNVGK